jgi:hypothetical protein
MAAQLAPSATQWLLSQQPELQVLPVQHGWPTPPQTLHLLSSVSQAALAALQGLAVAQQAWPVAPQVAVLQVPPVQTSPLLHVLPEATQDPPVARSQQPDPQSALVLQVVALQVVVVAEQTVPVEHVDP